MKFSCALAVALFLPALVNAQLNNTATPPGPGPTPSAAAPSNVGMTTPAGSISAAAPSNSGPGATMTAPGGSTFSASASADSAGTSGSMTAPQSSSPNLTPDIVPATTAPPGSSQAAGQESTAGVKPTGTSTGSPTLQETCPPGNTCVQVGSNGQLNYNPSNFAASNGTVVTFFFPPGSTSNSVTQGSFGQPCVYLTAAGGNPAGFDSGLQNDKMFSIKVTDDQLPIYFFSKEQKSCGQGMVGAVNPPSTGNTYNAYSDAAKALGPNQELVPDNGPVLGGVGAQAVGTPSPIPTTKGTSSSSHLVANGFVALLAAIFGITLA